MGTKYQDSTPQRKIWEVGKLNKPHAWNTWGYDSVLVGLIVDKGVMGEIVLEGFLGFKPLDKPEEAWGDWYAIDTVSLIPGKYSKLFKTIGYSQFRVVENGLRGRGKVQVALACHAI